MNRFAPYRAATGCTKYGPAGGQAFTTYTEDVFAELHRLMGICNCRPVVGGSSWSHHAECRAVDSGFTILKDHAFGYEYALILAEKAADVGIDHIITNARPWESGRGAPLVFSARSPSGRTYTGSHPHKDHNHTGLTRSAGLKLTYATLVEVYGPPEAVAARLNLTIGETAVLRKGDEGPAVGKHQEALLAWNPKALPEWGADKDFGPETETWVKNYQKAAGLAQSGIIDGVTSSLLLRHLPAEGASTGKHTHPATTTVTGAPSVHVKIGENE